MHPIERLRMVARAGREDSTVLAQEAASALASFGSQPAALVTACRRLVDRQPTCGPVWWLAARVLAAADPAREAWEAGEALGGDPTPSVVAEALPADATVVVVGWPEQAVWALTSRGDVRVLAVDFHGEGRQLTGYLSRTGGDAATVPESGVAGAVASASVVLVDAYALGPSGVVAAAGSAAVAAVAVQLEVPVWAVAGTGRVLPAPLWDALAGGLQRRGPAWIQAEELVPSGWLDMVAGPEGLVSPEEAATRTTCPPAPELVATPAG